jgi:CheY-like chemotaxis protein
VAKILVADDNSNIQKMVGLALKDQGIDVVAVGNGEAAVRKISDVRPDLVLADVFMPVRNGYEVCNYVKQDSALSHIPVILLVGAFDPLDEQEAQRVGADGVLKKPFVPPDPLISMVKSALTRAGVVLGAPEAATVPAPSPVVNTKPAPLTGPAIVPPPLPAEPEPEFALPNLSLRPAPLTINKGEGPLAFGSLLDTPAPEEEPVFSSPDNAVAPDRDWRQQAEQEQVEEEEEPSKTGTWRLSSMDETPDEAPAGQKDWREVAFAGIGDDKNFKEWAPSAEKNSLSITAEEAAELAKSQQPLSAQPSVTGAEDWSKAINEIFPEKPVTSASPIAAPVEVETTPTLTSEPAPAVEVPEPVPASTTPAATTPPDGPAAGADPSSALNSWMAGAVSPWESELQRANDLASSWDAAGTSPLTGPVPETEAAQATQAFLDSGLMAVAHERVTEAIEEARAEDQFVLEGDDAESTSGAYSTAATQLEDRNAPVPEYVPAAPAPETADALEPFEPALAEAVPESQPVEPAATPANGNMDELVAKVLAKMNPDVLQAVTREILKPVVEALVRDELNKK